MTIERFGSIDGVDVAGGHARRIRTAWRCSVLTWGAVIRDLVVPSRGQARSAVVLGLNSIEDYAAHSPYFGAIVGRYANRIGGARFVLDGKTYLLDANEGRNQLHGGTARLRHAPLDASSITSPPA